MKHTHTVSLSSSDSLSHTRLERNPVLGSDGWIQELCGCGWNGTNDRKTSEWVNKKTSGRQERATEMGEIRRNKDKERQRWIETGRQKRIDDSNTLEMDAASAVRSLSAAWSQLLLLQLSYWSHSAAFRNDSTVACGPVAPWSQHRSVKEMFSGSLKLPLMSVSLFCVLNSYCVMCGMVSSHSEQGVKDDVAWKAWAASD